MSTEFRIVPYDQSLRGASCRRPEPAARESTFGSFLQRGGRIRPMELGATAGASDEEKASLLTNQQMVKSYVQTNRASRVMMWGVLCTLFLVATVFIALGVVAWRVNSAVEGMRSTIAPHAEAMINSTLEMLSDTKGTIHSAKDTMEPMPTLVKFSVPDILRITNHSAALTERLYNLMKHPELKLSLGG